LRGNPVTTIVAHMNTSRPAFDVGVLNDAKVMLAEYDKAKRDDKRDPDPLARSFIATDGPALVRELERLAAEVDKLRTEMKDQRAKMATMRDPEDPAEKRWSEAVDWLLNSRHCGDCDIQAAFWGMVDGLWDRKIADKGWHSELDQSLVELHNAYEETGQKPALSQPSGAEV
jgi:hypothetical protein